MRPARILAAWFSVLFLACLLAGCRTARPPASAGGSEPPPDPGVVAAEALFEQGRVTDALVACVDLYRRDPFLPGLAELQQRILNRMAEDRERNARILAPVSQRRMLTDVEERRVIPATYGMGRGVRGETGSLQAPRTALEEALNRRVTVHLDGVGLTEFVLAIGAAEGISIITDAEGMDRTMTLHAEQVPLREILDFASRNLGVTFFVGENIIWATPAAAEPDGPPLETRVYRLRKGLSGEDLAGDTPGGVLVETLTRFIPAAVGADLHFDPKAHVLILRNTRANLGVAEALIDALDVLPPQVMIEARFIATSVSDLRELGIDWLLTGPITVASRPRNEFGDYDSWRLRANSGASVQYSGFPNQAQGLNMTVQGLLIDPVFQAVLHALETSGRARTLSVPKITALNNRTALIRVGEDFRYFEEYDVQSTPSTSDTGQTVYRTTLVPVGRPQVEELGIQLNVRPSVGADLSSISLTLLPEISEFVRYEYYRVQGADDDRRNGDPTGGPADSLVKIPIFRRSRIETEVVVRSGETVVMGGLVTSQENRVQGRVPFLSSIPLIGRLFTHDQVEELRQNLLIFVTASLLSEVGETLIPIEDLETGGADAPGPHTVVPED